MIEEITLGIFGVAFGIGAYLSARKMARGPVHYYGRTLIDRDSVTTAQEAVPIKYEAREAAVIMAYLLEHRDEFVSASELRMLLRSLSRYDKAEHYIPARFRLGLEPILERLEAASAVEAEKIRNATAHAEANAEESQKQKIDELEKRVRALEEKSAVAVEDPQALPANVQYLQ